MSHYEDQLGIHSGISLAKVEELCIICVLNKNFFLLLMSQLEVGEISDRGHFYHFLKYNDNSFIQDWINQ